MQISSPPLVFNADYDTVTYIMKHFAIDRVSSWPVLYDFEIPKVMRKHAMWKWDLKQSNCELWIVHYLAIEADAWS